jgi:hypothetical protein
MIGTPQRSSAHQVLPGTGRRRVQLLVRQQPAPEKKKSWSCLSTGGAGVSLIAPEEAACLFTGQAAFAVRDFHCIGRIYCRSKMY